MTDCNVERSRSQFEMSRWRKIARLLEPCQVAKDSSLPEFFSWVKDVLSALQDINKRLFTSFLV